MFNSQSPVDDVVRHLLSEYGPMRAFIDDIGEDLPIETLVEAMTIVNTAIGSDIDWNRVLPYVDGAWYTGLVTDENRDALGRAEDILWYAAEVQNEPDADKIITWSCYIDEARDAE
jgi:hypothetical protein